ncbi:alpha,alpha-trehalase TreF [Paraglaciecola sp.]|uniref:alpha,alpha-trehalase TreF n=1 Tax=Paraglaciecola sp. TaxID=1920173 RepID=UPI0030F4A528
MSNVAHDWHASLPFYKSQLFHDVQLSGLFDDSKTFADATPKSAWDIILSNYESTKNKASFDLSHFVDLHFTLPAPAVLNQGLTSNRVNDYIEHMWQVLTKLPDPPGVCSLIPLKRPYIVPGGRFREIYYWDSYFTALGLMNSAHQNRVQDMLENFLDIQQTVGLIPNGNRAYYHTRSQPPVLGLMCELVLSTTDDKKLSARCLAGMEQEYQFWMQGHEQLSAESPCHRRVILMPDGTLLNRYFDDDDSPRPESYREDIEAAAFLPLEQKPAFYRNLRAACESGWDFSSRWLDEPSTLGSINTTQIAPIDLNSLMYLLEKQLSRGFASTNAEKSAHYADCAKQRQQAINHYMWDAKDGLYRDYHLSRQQQTAVACAATAVPLFVGLCSQEQADAVANTLETHFLKAGGLVTTLAITEQQWDAPNGWAPLQWFAVKGLKNYAHPKLAKRIMQNWLNCVESYFAQHHTMLEKYNVCQLDATAKGGEYRVQLGFGWTNGVSQQFYRLTR